MIAEKQTGIKILTDGEQQETIGMSLDLDSANMLMQMLSKNLYSDGVGSSIRETASNALDSHRRAGVDEPIIVSFIRNKERNYEFSVEDFGTGLDEKDVEYIISKYGKSTKRMEANELGMFGLGFKAPLAYSSSFHFVCRKDGMERKYMMYEGDDFNKIDLLHETKTKERNGVKVIIPVKYNDRWDFINKMKEQLAYFEGVFFNLQDVGDTIDNDFKIFRNEVYQISELTEDSNLHICLDNVYYPIDFKKLGIERLNYKIGLRFGLTDGIFPTPNREAVRYTQEAKVIILNKIREFANHMVTVYNKNYKETDDIKSIFKYYRSSSRYLKIEDREYEISSLITQSKIPLVTPKFKGITLIDLKALSKQGDQMFNEYEKRYTLSNDRFSSNKGQWGKGVNFNTFENRNKVYTYDDRIGSNKKSYIKSLTTTKAYGDSAVFLKKVTEFELRSKKKVVSSNYYNSSNNSHDSYYQILNLAKHKKKNWRAVIEEFKFILKTFFKDVPHVDDIIIPQDWLDARKKKRIYSTNSAGVRIPKLKGEISCKKAEDLLRYVDGKNAKFTPHRYNLETLHKLPALIIYGTQEQQGEIDKLYHISKNQKMRFILLSQRELNVIDKIEIQNLMSIEKFMEGKNKPFRRLITGYLISELIRKYRYVFNKRDRLKTVCSSLQDKLSVLKNYENNQITVRNTDIYNILLEVAETHNLYDETIYPEYLECKAILERLKFLNPIMEQLSNYTIEDDPLLDALTDLFKYYKYKVNFDKYHMRLNEDLPLEDTLTEETVEELQAAVD